MALSGPHVKELAGWLFRFFASVNWFALPSFRRVFSWHPMRWWAARPRVLRFGRCGMQSSGGRVSRRHRRTLPRMTQAQAPASHAPECFPLMRGPHPLRLLRALTGIASAQAVQPTCWFDPAASEWVMGRSRAIAVRSGILQRSAAPFFLARACCWR